jgi:hypothetical protein
MDNLEAEAAARVAARKSFPDLMLPEYLRESFEAGAETRARVAAARIEELRIPVHFKGVKPSVVATIVPKSARRKRKQGRS